MATIRAYTTIEQSKKLGEILPLESADMSWSFGNIKFMDNDYDSNVVQDIPSWSLAALLDVLPRIEGLKPVLDLEINYIQYPSDIYLRATSDNPINACYKMVIKLNELNLL